MAKRTRQTDLRLSENDPVKLPSSSYSGNVPTVLFLSRVLVFCLVSPPRGTCPENLKNEASRGHPDQMPGTLQITNFDTEKQRLYFELPPDLFHNWS